MSIVRIIERNYEGLRMIYKDFLHEFGVVVYPYKEAEYSLSPNWGISPFDNADYQRPAEVDQHFLLGRTSIEDCPPRFAYKYSLAKNDDTLKQFGRYMKLLEKNEEETRGIVGKFRFTALDQPSKWTGKTQEILREVHYRIFEKWGASKSLSIAPTSAICGALIPTLSVYKSIEENDRSFTTNNATDTDFEKWKNFVLANDTVTRHFFRIPLSAYLDINAFNRHGYITGMTGSGKTEFQKLLIHYIITKMMPNDPTAGGVLIDPHGDISKQVAQFKECYGNDRVLYLDASLYDHLSWSIDIFKSYSSSELENETYANYLGSAIEEMIPKASTTAQMDTILKPCLCVLFNRPNSDLEDLQRFMLDGENEDLIELGKQLSNRAQADFFKNGFTLEKYKTTKEAIYTRIQSLRNSRHFSRNVNRAGTLDIEKELNNGKFLIFNLSKSTYGDEQVIGAIGRLILAQINGMGYRRDKMPISKRPKSYIIVDECRFFIGTSIKSTLADLRKYNVRIILTSQIIGQEMSPELVKMVLSNTGVKVTGLNKDYSYSVIEKNTGVSREELNKLSVGKFSISIDSGKKRYKPFTIKAPTYCLDNHNSMGLEKWKETIKRKRHGYTKITELEAKYVNEDTYKVGSEKIEPETTDNTPKFTL